jgi:DNA gyrase/topoisomerase IV subunit B
MKKAIKNDVDKYDKKTQREHILTRPDTYIGYIEPTQGNMYVYQDSIIVKKNITFTPGFFSVFNEIIVNAWDASIRDPTVSTIKVTYNKEEGFIQVYNDGDIGIPIEEHPVHKTLIPSMIFGELLTSSNYDDTEERITGGKNGYGGKVVSIFSTKFIVEIADAKRKKHYSQTWLDNMLVAEDAIVTKLPAKIKNSVTVTFYPDFKRFGITDLNNDHYDLFYRRVIDIAGVSKKLKVYFNDVKIDINNFKDYIELYNQDGELYYDTSDRWSVGVLYKPDLGHEVISFVNSINTYCGGTHCNHVIDNIIKTLINDYIKKKDKNSKITPAIVKDNFHFFINSIIVNPAFSSQTKETLTTKVDKFGSKYEPSPAFLKKLVKCGIVEQMIELSKIKETSSLKKTDGKKQIKILGIPKLEDANKAGSKESYKCTLILTEGDSAKATAMSGLGVLGRDYYGVFPLKGKLLNVRDANPSQLLANEEITHLKSILGLKQGEDYSDIAKFNNLRYGHVMLLVDADFDGSHIKGLFMNMIHALWPSLIHHKEFILGFHTPIVKAFKGKEELEFYALSDYESWRAEIESNNWKIKYYKGLGTSTSDEAKKYFKNINKNQTEYIWEEDDDKYILLAFDKSKADDRKKWILDSDENDVLTYEQTKISYGEFINKDLINFSKDDLHRSIPSVIDGYKPSQRKIHYGAISRKLDKDEVKVSQLAGYVSDITSYHHGEMSLNGAIIGMAQNFVGSNNINILKPNGQFGCLDPNTEVLMWEGYIKLAKDIKCNDNLIGDDGTMRTVLNLTSGIDDMFKITTDSGEKYIVNSQHLITVFNKTTNEIIDIKITDYFDKYTSEDLYMINNSSSIDWQNKPVIIDPYCYGFSLYKYPNINLRDYIINDTYTRLYLLAGILDAVGCSSKTHYQIECTIDILKSVKFLIRSLGYNCFANQIHENMIRLDIYGINLKEIPVKVIKKIFVSYNFTYMKFKIENIGQGQFNGFSIDKNERFLLGNFIITHNSRLKGGKDAASSRYIWTMLEDIIPTIFNSSDNPILNNQFDDGLQIEPEYYAPIIPMVLVNGAEGIGTGFSTKIPPYNPLDIIKNIKNIINEDEFEPMDPWWQGFDGTVIKINDFNYEVNGNWKIKDNKLIITELPVGEWTSNYKEFLEKILNTKNSHLLNYVDNNTDTQVYFELIFEDGYLDNNPGIEKTLHLCKKLSITNMHLFGPDGSIKKYNTIEEIMIDYYNIRVDLYTKRQQHQLSILKKQLKMISYKVKFILMVIEKKININNTKKQEIEEKLEHYKFPKLDNMSYDYLLSMPIYNLTFEKIEELKKQQEDKTNEYEELESKSPEDIWLYELNVLEVKYNKFYNKHHKIKTETEPIEITTKVKAKSKAKAKAKAKAKVKADK